jgi:tetratricopeptide (TPR) repeat protein
LRQADAYRNLVQVATPADALALLGKATELAPRQDEFWYLHGRTALIAARSQLSQAERASLRAIARASLERALLISPFNPNHLISLARLNFDMAQDTENPTDRNTIANRSDNYSAAALRLNPHDARWWQNWAVLDYEVFHDFDAATEKLQRALTEDPTNSRSLVLLGNVSAARALSPQATSEDFADALEFYSAALVNPVGTSTAEIKLLIGNLWLQRGAASTDPSSQKADYKTAADLFEQVVSEPIAVDAALESDDQVGSTAKFTPWMVHRTLAQLYMTLQQPKAAGEHATLALATAAPSEREQLLQLQAASAAQLLANPRP